MARLNTNLTGDAFLRDLANTRNVAYLEALWRAAEPGLCVRLLPHIGAVKDTRLGGLVLDEYLAPRLAAPVPEAILRAASSSEPPALSPSDSRRLIERLRAEPHRQGHFPPARPSAEQWALAQGGPDALTLAKEIATDDVPFSHSDAVTTRALRRAAETSKSRDEVAARLSERLTAERSQAAWVRAAGFLEVVPTDQDSASLARLADQVVETAPNLAQAGFSEALKKRVSAAPEAAEHRLAQGPIQNGAGGQSIAQVIEGVKGPETRGRMTAIVVLRQTDLYNVIRGPLSRWSDDEWATRLAGIAAADRAQPTPGLLDMIAHAPHVHAPLIMRVAARHGAPDHQALRAAAVAKVKARFGEVVADGFKAEAVDALAWPAEAEDPIVEMTKATLKEVVPANSRAILVGEAVAVGALGANAAPLLLDPSEYAGILTPSDLQGERLRAVAASLYDAAPAHMFKVISQTQSKGFVLDFTRALASRSPEAAFAGAAAAHRSLSEADKDDLIDVLEAHGGWKQEGLLAAFASETSAKAAPRRIRAIAMTGRVAPSDQAAPTFVVDAVSTSRPDLLEVTFGVIASLRPRDVALATRLRETAQSEGAPGRAAAAAAVTALTSAYISALDEATTPDESRLLLALLGATATPEGIDTLLRYLGGEAEDDHPLVKQAAAAGLDEAARGTAFTADQLRRLGQLLDGPQPEGDATARALLVDVLGRAALGESQALVVLYGLINRKPKGDPADLFGEERSRLLRAAALYERSSNLGGAGWPGMIEQLDNMAMCVTRAAYLVAGDSEPTKALIRANPQRPEYGALLNMLGGDLTGAKGRLLALHHARNEETEFSHPGSPPSEDTVTTARTNFGKGVTILVGILEKDAAARRAGSAG